MVPYGVLVLRWRQNGIRTLYGDMAGARRREKKEEVKAKPTKNVGGGGDGGKAGPGLESFRDSKVYQREDERGTDGSKVFSVHKFEEGRRQKGRLSKRGGYQRVKEARSSS